MPNQKPPESGRNILVIGGAGYVGSRIIPALKAQGHRVSVVDLLWFGDHLPADVPITRMDVMDMTPESFKGFDTVIFLAGLSNDPMAEFDARTNFISNAPGPAYCAMMAKKAGVARFIYASSCSVYGTSQGEVNEEGPVLAQSHYGVSKYMGEVGSMQYMDRDFAVVALRMGTISGYSPRMRFDLLLNTMYMKAATANKIDVRNPKLRRPYFAMSDVERAYLWALNCHGGVYNVLSGNTTVGECARAVRVFFKAKHGIEVTIAEQTLADPRDYAVDDFRAIGQRFIAKGSIASILDELDREVGITGDFSQDVMYNIRVFQKL